MPDAPFTSISFVTVLDDHTTVDETIAAIASQAGLPGKIDAVAVNPHPAIAANRERLAAIDPAAAWHHHRVGIPDRAAATWECGYSNAIHDRRHGGSSRPCYCNQSARVHCRRAWKWKARWLLSRDSGAREKYWINMLALAYLEGYSKGARQSSSELPCFMYN